MSAGLLVCLQIVGHVLRFFSKDCGGDVTPEAAGAELFAALGLAVLLRLEHRHAIRASAFLAVYLTFGAIVDGIQSRTLFATGCVALGGITGAAAGTRLVIIILEEIPKLQHIIDPEIRRASDGEPTSGFWTRSFLCFLWPVFAKGYHSILRIDQLVPIGIEFSSKRLLVSILARWKSVQQANKNSLLFACAWEYKFALVGIIIPRLCQTGFTFAEPYTIQQVISVISGVDDDHLPSKGSLAAANFLAFAGSAVCRAISKHMVSRLVTRVRGGLISLMLHKSLRLSASDPKRAAAVTHMSTDIDTLVIRLPMFLETPFTVFECGFGIYLLLKMVQQSSFVVAVPFLLATVIGYIFGRRSTIVQKESFKRCQNRVESTSKMLHQLLGIKMLGLGPKAAEYIHHLRIMELQSGKLYSRIVIRVIMCAYFWELMCPVLVVTAAVRWGGLGIPLSPQQVYPTLALVALVEYPIAMLFRAFPILLNTIGCFQRIQEFLCTEEHIDPRVLLGNTPREITRRWPTTDGASTIMTKRVSRHPLRVAQFENVSIAAVGSKTPILRDVELAITPGSITGVFGSTGSGKTTLLHSILGEVDILNGILYVNDVPIAYVGQEIYLPNQSIRDCIVGLCEYEEEWFRTVVTRCRLVQDIAQLPGGEDYVVGSNGIKLSGGQCQRVSIARAVYAREEIVILDDAFSALDRKNARAIINNLCGPQGLLRTSGTTVVVASYLPEVLDLASSVVFLDGSGNVHHENGTVSVEFRTHILSLLREEHNGDWEDNTDDAPEDDPQSTDSQGTDTQAVDPQSLEPAESTLPAQTTHSASAQHISDTIRQQGDKTLYWFWMKAAGIAGVTTYLSFMAVVTLVDVFSLIFLKLWMDNAPNSQYWLIGYALLPVGGVLFIGAALLMHCTAVTPTASAELHREMILAVTASTVGFLSATDAGYILNRFSVDMDVLTKVIPGALHNMVYHLGGCLSQVGVITSGTKYMLIFLPFIVLCLWLLQQYYLRTSRQLQHLKIEAQAPLVTAIQETTAGLVYLRSFRWTTHNLETSLHLLDETQKPAYLLLSSQHLLALFIFLLMALLTLVLSLLTLYAPRGGTANSAGAAFLAISVLGERLQQSILEWTTLEIGIGALDRTRSFLENTPRETDRLTSPLPDHWPSRGEVTMRGLTARYRVDDTIQAPVLRNISLKIEAGKKVGVTGRTGSGKSSLLYALLGFLDYNGSILIDGIEISTAPRDELRSRIITISQDQVELDGSIRENLLPFETRWDPRLLEERGTMLDRGRDKILRETLVRLRIWDKLETKGGLDTLLKDAGYSYGEKQLLCIARAVVRRRLTGNNLLLVDEATGSVDRWRDQIVREMMKEYFKGCTIIVVAHREESIADTTVRVKLTNGGMGAPDYF